MIGNKIEKKISRPIDKPESIVDKELEAKLILDRHIKNKERFLESHSEDEYINRLVFFQHDVAKLQEKSKPIINEELEECLNELFPKKRTSDENLRAEICHICFDVPNNEKNQKILRLIEKIQKESGRDRALVLVGVAQKIIDETERQVMIKLTKQHKSKIWD